MFYYFIFYFICFFLFYFVLFYFILFYFILFCFVLFCFILFYFILFCFILFCFVLFYFILFYFILEPLIMRKCLWICRVLRLKSVILWEGFGKNRTFKLAILVAIMDEFFYRNILAICVFQRSVHSQKKRNIIKNRGLADALHQQAILPIL